MLSKFKIRLIALIMVGGITTPSAYAVLLREQARREVKAEQNVSYYKSVEKAYEIYRSDREKVITDSKRKSIKQMEQAKVNYEKLLANQKNLIAAHTKQVEEYILVENRNSKTSSKKSEKPRTATSTTSSTSTASVSKSSSSSSTTVKVASKPKVSSKTKSS